MQGCLVESMLRGKSDFVLLKSNSLCSFQATMRRQREERRGVFAGALWKARQDSFAGATTIVVPLVGNRERGVPSGRRGAVGMKCFNFDQHKISSAKRR